MVLYIYYNIKLNICIKITCIKNIAYRKNNINKILEICNKFSLHLIFYSFFSSIIDYK